jgi:universal stress protein A
MKKASAKKTKSKPAGAKRGGTRVTKFQLRRILVPLDFSGKSRQALATAIPLAERYGAKIILIHVIETAYLGGAAGFAYLPVDNARFVEKALLRLKQTAAKLIPPGLLDRVIVREGAAYHEINAAARKLKADLIVIATQGHAGLNRVLLGSTAERVVRHASGPVLTVRRN